MFKRWSDQGKQKLSRKEKRTPTYYWLLGTTIVMLLVGLIMIFSASSAFAFTNHGDSYYYLKKQALWAAIGFGVMLFLSRFDYRRLRGFTFIFLVVNFAGLIMVLIPGFGRAAGGAVRTLELGPLSFQPSEFAKLALLLYTADFLTKKRKKLKDLSTLIPLFVVAGATAFLVMFQPDMGTTMVICFTVYIMLFLSGMRLHHIAGLGIAGVVFAALFAFAEDYRRERVLSFLNPWADPRDTGFHIIQSLIAFGSGGIWGVGLGLSRQKFSYLPAVYTDSILAVIGEELGLVGTTFVVLLFAVFGYLGIRIAFRSPDYYGRLVGGGLTALILSQALVNMGAVTGSIPITGIPLPLISYGRSSLVVTLAGIGILLNLSLKKQKKKGQAVNDANRNLGRWDRRTRLPRVSTG